MIYFTIDTKKGFKKMHDKTRILGVVKKLLKNSGKTNEDIISIENAVSKEGGDFFIHCLENKIVNEDEIVQFLTRLNYEVFDWDSVRNTSEFPILSNIKESFFRKHLFIPTYYTENKVSIVTVNPLNEDLSRELKTLLDVHDVEVEISNYTNIQNNLKSYSICIFIRFKM